MAENISREHNEVNGDSNYDADPFRYIRKKIDRGVALPKKESDRRLYKIWKAVQQDCLDANNADQLCDILAERYGPDRISSVEFICNIRRWIQDAISDFVKRPEVYRTREEFIESWDEALPRLSSETGLNRKATKNLIKIFREYLRIEVEKTKK